MPVAKDAPKPPTPVVVPLPALIPESLPTAVTPVFNGLKAPNRPVFAMGERHVLVVKPDGTLWTWGANESGQLGDGSKLASAFPIQIASELTMTSSKPGPKDFQWVAVAAGDAHSMALRSDGTVWIWGGDKNSLLGTNGGLGIRPHRVTLPGPVVSIACSAQSSFAALANGALYAWGRNTFAELGMGDHIDRPKPQIIPLTLPVSKVAGRKRIIYALMEDHSAWLWGDGDFGSSGALSRRDRTRPTKLGFDSDWSEITGGEGHALGVRTDGTLWAVGEGLIGQLGDGARSKRLTPAQSGNAKHWMSVGAAGQHSFGLTKQGDLFAWGENPGGVLGNGTTLPQVTPVRIPPQAGWLSVVAGETFTVALRTDGSLWAWGENRHGELGVGNQISSWVPVRVSFSEIRLVQKPLADFSEMIPARQ